MFSELRCPRCDRKLSNLRRWREHTSRPCAEDNVLVKRQRAAERRASGIPERPRRRGRKLYMRPTPERSDDGPS